MIYLDANIIIYTVSGDVTYSKACTAILTDIERGKVSAGASTLTLLEVVGALRKLNNILIRKKRKPLDIAKNIDAVNALPIVWFDMTALVVERSLDYHDSGIQTADAIHCATAVLNDIKTVVSADAGFDACPDLTRRDPLQYR